MLCLLTQSLPYGRRFCCRYLAGCGNACIGDDDGSGGCCCACTDVVALIYKRCLSQFRIPYMEI